MVLWIKFWYRYYTENYGTSIYEGKKRGRLPKTMNYNEKKPNSNMPKQLKFLNKYLALEL